MQSSNFVLFLQYRGGSFGSLAFSYRLQNHFDVHELRILIRVELNLQIILREADTLTALRLHICEHGICLCFFSSSLTQCITVFSFSYVESTYLLDLYILIWGCANVNGKHLHDPDNHLQPDILKCDVSSGPQETSRRTKLVEVMEFQLSYFKS